MIDAMKNKDSIIIFQLKKGDDKAYRFIYNHHYEVLCKFATHYLGDAYLGETVVSDTILHLWEIRENLDIQGSLRNYLFKAVRNRCLNQLHSKCAQSEVTLSSLQPDDWMNIDYFFSDEQPLGTLLAKELEAEIVKSIRALPAECSTVFKKSRFEHKKYEEIATELGISVNTVKYHMKNALASLSKALKKHLITLFLLFLV